jgi:2-polyprenyl-6-methoxyphenol hydroxylase-like FAD-dependent oxidoreductase
MAESTPIEIEETSIIIVGGGPTGALLSAFLGQLEVPNVLLEREDDITTDPRGIALDYDGLRLLQAISMNHRSFTRIGSCECSLLDEVVRGIGQT